MGSDPEREELLARIDLGELLVELTGIDARGRAFPCPNPDHEQTGKTPPVSISFSNGYAVWNCHRCGAGGTAIDALQLAHNVDAGGAFAELRRRTGAKPTRTRAPHNGPKSPPASQHRMSNGRAKIDPAAAYLLERGFPERAVLEVGWRVEPLGNRYRRYGLPAGAAEAAAWIIPYRHPNGNVAFERIRLIGDADLERFGGGKYRQPAGRALALYDPYGSLEGPLDAALLVEGEANAVAVHVMLPELAVIGLPGQSALTTGMADQLGHAPIIYVWIDRHEKGAQANIERIARLLRAAGVEDVRLLPETGGLDANDALREFGVERAARRLDHMLQQAEHLAADQGLSDWPALATPELPSFPLEAFPDQLGRFVDAIAVETQTPPDLAALAVLGTLSALSLGMAVVDCGTWEEELALYLLPVMPTGDRKSQVLRSVLAPLRKLEAEWRETTLPHVRERLTRQQALEARRQKLVRKASELDDPEARAEAQSELEDVAAQLDALGETAQPNLLADDATPEMLGTLIDRHGRIGVLAAEAPLIDNLIGRYDAKGSANLHLVCHAYTGEPTRIDRRSRSEHLERPLLAITLTVQPHVLRALIEHPLARNQGLVGRFAYALPESQLGRRETNPPSVPAELHAAWEQIVRRLDPPDPLTKLTQPGFVSFVSTPEREKPTLSLSLPAKKLLDQLRGELEPRLGEHGDLRSVADWINRHAGRVARIAGLLHLAEHLPETRISEATMLRALLIGEYLLAHGVFALTEPDETVRRALVWLARRDEETVSQRDLQRGPLAGRGTAEKASQLAQALVEAGALRRTEDEGRARPGRPAGPTYAINPNLRANRSLR